MEGPSGKEWGRPLASESGPRGQPARKQIPNPTTMKNWIQLTTWMSLEANSSPGAFSEEQSLSNALLSACEGLSREPGHPAPALLA